MTQEPTILPRIETDLVAARVLWERAHKTSIGASSFTEWSFLQELETSFGWTRCFVFWADEVAVCFFIRTRGPVKDMVVPPFTPYSAVLLSRAVEEEMRPNVLEQIFKAIPGLPSARLISLDPTLTSYAAFDIDYERIERQTYFVSCKRPEEMVAGFSENTRRNLKKSSTDYALLTEAVSLQEVASFVWQGYAAHGKRASLSPDKLFRLASSVADKPFSATFGIVNKKSGKLEAGIVYLVYKSMAWYWFAGSLRGPAMTVLLAKSLNQLSSGGVATLDFMGANTPGISEFKRRFGGDLVSYAHFRKTTPVHAALGKLSQLIRRR